MRLATEQDAARLLNWRNDIETRHNSLQKHIIEADNHLAWLKQKLADPLCRLYIIEQHAHYIGTIRVDTIDNAHKISWTIAPEYRGRGFAKKALRLLTNKLSGLIIAMILPDNHASIKIATSAGLTYQHRHDGVLYYVLDKQKS